MRRLAILAALLAGSALAAAAATAAEATDLRRPAGADWTLNGGDWANSRYSVLRQINPATVGRLGAAWVVDFPGANSKAVPVVQDGRMFVAVGSALVALDGASGRELWRYQPKDATFLGIMPGYANNKGVALGEGLLFIGLSNGMLLAVRQATGEAVWSRAVGDTPPLPGQVISAAPTYVNGLVIAGLGIGDYNIRGRVMAFRAATGEPVWRFDTIPAPGEPGHETWPQDSDLWQRGGGGLWQTPVVDPDLGVVLFGTGNAQPHSGGELRAGDNLYTASVVALDLKTGKYRWHHQLTHHELWDADVATPLVLYEAVIAGRPRKAVAAMRTDGELFVFDRATGEPLFAIEERPVRQNARLKTAATQPFPATQPIGPRCVEPDQAPPGFVLGCFYDTVDVDQPNLLQPFIRARVAPMALDPATARLFVGTQVAPHWFRRSADPMAMFAPSQAPGMKSYGLITALDGRTGRIAWERRVPYALQQSGGFTATAGGLLLHGEPDGNFQALDMSDGKLLWQFQTGASVDGPAMTYEVGGVQHVAVMATGSLWTFRLDGTKPPRPAPTPPRTETAFAGRIVEGDRVTLAPAGPEADEHAVRPLRLRVAAGGRVTWTNEGKTAHSAAAVDGSWTTGSLAPGQSKTLTFARPGTYSYVCPEHPWSYAQLIVQ